MFEGYSNSANCDEGLIPTHDELRQFGLPAELPARLNWRLMQDLRAWQRLELVRLEVLEEIHAGSGLTRYPLMLLDGWLRRGLAHSVPCLGRESFVPVEEFVSLRTCIEAEFGGGYHLKTLGELGKRRAHASHGEVAREELGSAVGSVLVEVADGLPLYLANGSGFRRATRKDASAGYLLTGIEYGDFRRDYGDLPSWSDELFVSTRERQLLEPFRSWRCAGEEEARLLRAAFRAYVDGAFGIHLADDLLTAVPRQSNAGSGADDSPIVHRTRMTRLLRETALRFYGSTFDTNDRDSWTSQATIVAWLREKHGVSKREAQAIDIMLRPDAARGASTRLSL